MTKRDTGLTIARVAGYHGDGAAFYRACVDYRVAHPKMLAAWREGGRAKLGGTGCACPDCKAVAS